MEEKKEKGVRSFAFIFSLLLFLLFINHSFAVEPVITISKHELEFSMIGNSMTSSRFFVYTSGGDENVDLSINVVGNLSNWIKFSRNNFTLPPNFTQEISFEIVVPEATKAGEYIGKIILYSSKGQIEEINLKVNVLEYGGRFKVECFSGENVIKDFSVLIYSNDKLVDSGTSVGGVFLSNFLPYGEYKIKILSQGYYDAEKILILNKKEQVASFKLKEIEEVKLKIIPEKIVVKFCSGEGGITSLKLVNSANYPIPVKLNSTSPNIKIEETNFTVQASSSKEVKIKFDFPQGNYTEKLYVSHEEVVDEVIAEITSISSEECKAEYAFSISGRNSIKLVENFTSSLVIYINPYEDLEKVKISVKDSNLSVEIYPIMYAKLRSGEARPFLLRIKPTTNFSTSLELSVSSSMGEKTFSIKLYRAQDLDKDEIRQEIEELKSLVSNLRTDVLDLSARAKEGESEEVKVISLKLSDFSVKLDVAKTALDTNPGASKSYVEDISLELGNVLNELLKFDERKELQWPLYISAGIGIAVISLVILVIRKKFFT